MTVKLRKRKRSNNNYSLYLDIYQDGQRRTEYLGLYLTEDKITNKSTQQLAENIRAKRQLEFQNESYGFASESKKKENFVLYFQKLVNSRPADRSSWHCTFVKLKTFTKGSIAFQHITPEWLNNFKTFLLDEVAQTTAYHYYSNIKYALNKAVKERIINSNPCILVENIKKPDVQREYLTLEEIKKLNATDYPFKEIKDAFIFSCFTGLRYSDVKNLKWENIKGDNIEYRQKKTKRVEYLPLSLVAQNILTKKRLNVIEQNQLVFNLQSKSVFSNHIRSWVKKADIGKRVSFHTARHTFATLSLTQGVDLYTVSKLLGHKDISTTQIYAKIVDAKKVEAINKLPEL